MKKKNLIQRILRILAAVGMFISAWIGATQRLDELESRSESESEPVPDDLVEKIRTERTRGFSQSIWEVLAEDNERKAKSKDYEENTPK